MEAKLKYKPQKLEVIEWGEYVVCAVTKEEIPLEELRYWSVENQEPYKDASAALKRKLQNVG